MTIKSLNPYLFLVVTFSFLALINAEKKTLVISHRDESCATLVAQIIAPETHSHPTRRIASSYDYEELIKIKNKTWNSILNISVLNQINDQSYIKWVNYYRDDFFREENISPKTIDQKMALIQVINEYINYEDTLGKNKRHEDIFSDYLSKLDISQDLDQKSLNDFTIRLFLKIKNTPEFLAKYYLKNLKGFKLNRKIINTLQYDIVSMGLQNLSFVLNDSNNEQLQQIIGLILDNRIYQELLSDEELRVLRELKLSPALMKDIVHYGLNENHLSLLTSLKELNATNDYEIVLSSMKKISFITTYYYIHTRDESKKHDREQYIKEMKILASKLKAYELISM